MKNKVLIFFVQPHQRRKYNVTMSKKKRIKVTNCSSKINLHLSFTKIKHFFQLPAFYFVHPWRTTPLVPWTSFFVLAMWALTYVESILDKYSWSKNDSNYFDVKHKVFKKMTKKIPDWWKILLGEADFNQIMRMRNHVVIAAENHGREDNLSRMLIPTMSKYMDENFKLAHEVVDVVD